MKAYYAKAKLQGTQRNDSGALECWRAAIGEVFQWQPIEDAPLDGTIVIVMSKEWEDNNKLATAKYEFGDWRDVSGNGDTLNCPTHFFPLPLIG